MKLDEFVKTEQENIVKFAKFWKLNSEKFDHIFPNEMNEGDWYDHFLIWVEDKEEGLIKV